MKKVVFVLIALIAFNVQAQKEHQGKKNNMTPEQMATLRTKQMTLDLDLNEKQQQEVLAINQKNAETFGKMKGKMKDLSDDERFEMKNKMLDMQIANQKAMKNILDEEQFEKWKKMQKSRMNKMKKKHGQHAKKGSSKEKKEQ